MTPGCSSNVRFTRSSNSRMRSIWVKTQTSRSRSRPVGCAVTLCELLVVSCDARAELRARRLVRPPEDLVHREVAQLLGEHLDAPWPGGAVVAEDLHVGRHLELALAGQPAMVDRLVDAVAHVLVLSVAQLDPREVVERDAPELLGGDAELAHVPRVDGDPAVRSARAGRERHRVVEALH